MIYRCPSTSSSSSGHGSIEQKNIGRVAEHRNCQTLNLGPFHVKSHTTLMSRKVHGLKVKGMIAIDMNTGKISA